MTSARPAGRLWLTAALLLLAGLFVELGLGAHRAFLAQLFESQPGAVKHLGRARHFADFVCAVLAADRDVSLARGDGGHLRGHRLERRANGAVEVALGEERDKREDGGKADPHHQQARY